jgi:hypothetical protein
MDSTTLHRGVDAANAAGSVQQIVFLDSVWTRYLAEAKTIPPSDVEPLAGIVAEMNRLLSGVLNSLPPLLESLAAGSALDLRALIRETGARLHTDAAKVQHFLKICDDLGGDQRAANKLRTRLVADIPAARQELDQKVARIRSGRFTPGDLPKVGCAFGYSLFMLGHWLGSSGIEDAGWNIMMDYC